MAIDYTTAGRYLDAGLCVLRAVKAQKRPNLNSWEYYKTQLPTNKDLALWFGDNSSGICIVCGTVSGNLEIIDFDEKGLAFGPWGDRVKNDELIPGLYDKLVVEQSPSLRTPSLRKPETGENRRQQDADRNERRGRAVSLRADGGLRTQAGRLHFHSDHLSGRTKHSTAARQTLQRRKKKHIL